MFQVKLVIKLILEIINFIISSNISVVALSQMVECAAATPNG